MGICVEERKEGGKKKGIEMRERRNICDWVRDTSLGGSMEEVTGQFQSSRGNLTEQVLKR